MIPLKLNYLFICLLTLFCFNVSFGQTEIRRNGDILYLSNTVIIKLNNFSNIRADGNAVLSNSLQSLLNQFNTERVEALFPQKAFGGTNDLGKIFEVRYESDIDPFDLSSKLKNNNEIEWAEPRFIYQLDFEPDDPSYPSQWNLEKISAPLAWNISQGSSSVIIGIIDTGVDWDHPDLNANIWTNTNEIPNNGVDDDGNGFPDDVRGWDFGGLDGTPDNNPQEDQPDHGTHVAGISSAVTNNGIGISSIGFNSEILPVKASRNDVRDTFGNPLIYYGYEGIVYAIENGAKVINCSWGGGGLSLYAQEIINYATSAGALVVAAAGNSGTNLSHYPSGYPNVLSVASTNSDDTKSAFSTYGQTVDVSAPGNAILSTWQDNTYASLSGTSMSSPLTAGLAALVWSVFPSYTPMQIAEQIRVNSDNVDALNSSYARLMGRGRINALASLTNTNSLSVRATEIVFTDDAPGGNGDGIFMGGETISVAVKFINYLNPTSSLIITLENKNVNSTIGNGMFNAGSRNMLEEFDNFSSKFTFTLNESLPENVTLDFILNFSDGSYSDYQWLSTTANPSYATQAGNDISLTITSKGTLGYNDYPSNLQGSGFHYLDDSPNLLFEGALILATSSTQVSDAARGSNQSLQNTDFTVVQPFVLDVPGTIADYQGTAVFNDNGAGTSKIGTSIKLESFSFTDEPHNNYIILKYNITNNNPFDISTLYTGLFFDWDIIDGSGAGDVTTYDTLGNLSFTHNTTSGPETWIATALISSEDYAFWAIRNEGGDGGFQIYDGFTDEEKFQALSNGIGKKTAGPADISHIIGGGPFSIRSNETIDIGFVVGAASDLQGLRTIVSNAKLKYPSLVSDVNNEGVSPAFFSLSQNYPNPFNPLTKIKFHIASYAQASLKIYDVLGNEIAILVNEAKYPGEYEVIIDAYKYNLSSGIYFYQLKAGEYIATKKFVLIK